MSHFACMRVDQLLAWEARQEFTWEFDGVKPVTKPGTTSAHTGETVVGVRRFAQHDIDVFSVEREIWRGARQARKCHRAAGS